VNRRGGEHECVEDLVVAGCPAILSHRRGLSSSPS
jgi:hypothetical protein